MSQIPKNRTDLLPHYARLIAILNRYMPDIGSEVVASVHTSVHCTVAHTADVCLGVSAGRGVPILAA